MQVYIRCVLSHELFFFLHWLLESWYVRWSHGYIRAQGDACARSTEPRPPAVGCTLKGYGVTSEIVTILFTKNTVFWNVIQGATWPWSWRQQDSKELPYISTKLHCVTSQKDGTYANNVAILSSFSRRLTLNIVTKSYWTCRQHDRYLYNKRKEYPLNFQRALHVH